MRSAARRVLLIGCMTLLQPMRALAQESTCAPSLTVDECFAVLAGPREAAIAEATDSARDGKAGDLEAALLGKATGIGTLGPGLASAISDFLPTLAGALGLTQTTTEDGATSLETNLLLPFGSSPQRVKLQGVFRKPSLFEPLRQALPTATQDSRAAALEKELRDFDDVGITAAWNLETSTFGRSFEKLRPLYDNLFQNELTEFHAARKAKEDATPARQRYLAILNALGDADLDPAQGCTLPRIAIGTLKLDCLRQEKRAELLDAMAAFASVTVTREREFDAQLEESGFYLLPDLANNQPQLNIQVTADLRRDLVGPNDYAITARYEGGFANVNGLRKSCGATTDKDVTRDCLRQFTNRAATLNSIRRGDRFFIAATFTRRQDYHVVLSSDAVDLTIAGTWDVTASAGYGRYVAHNRAGEEIGRIDLGGEYVFHHDDPDRQNRLVASATYTYRLSPSLVVAVGASYANNPEFLGDVDKKVSANFGLRYKIGEL